MWEGALCPDELARRLGPTPTADTSTFRKWATTWPIRRRSLPTIARKPLLERNPLQFSKILRLLLFLSNLVVLAILPKSTHERRSSSELKEFTASIPRPPGSWHLPC